MNSCSFFEPEEVENHILINSVKRRRLERSWTQEELARRIGVKHQNSSKMGTGRRCLSQEVKPSEKGWNTFRTLGDNAVVGCLKNAAQNHDHYLYNSHETTFRRYQRLGCLS